MINKYPYTNFHELNLDWIIATVKEWGEQIKLLDKKFDSLESAFEDLKEYVENYLSALDIEADVVNAVNDYLDANLTQPVIANVLKNAMLIVGGNVNPHRLLRLAMPTTTQTANPDNTVKTWAQGFCITPNGYLMAFCNNAKVNNDADFYEVTPEHLLYRSFTLPVGHANAIAYDDNKLYVAPLYYNVGGSEQRTNDLLVYDYDTLSLIDTITCLVYPHSVSVDQDIIYYTNNLAEYIELYKYDGFNHEYVGQFKRPVNGTYQNADVVDGVVYFAYSEPSLIYEYDIVTGELLAIFNFPTVTKEGFNVGELEQIKVVDRDIYVFGENALPSSMASYRYGQLFVFNTNTGNEDMETVNAQHSVSKLIYAEKGAINNYGNLNPTGQSTNVFTTSDEALLFAMYNNIQCIRFRGNFSESVLYVNRPLTIYGYSVAGTMFESFYVFNAGRVLIQNMTFNSVATRTYANDIERSDLFLNNCAVNGGLSIPLINIQLGALELQHCTITTDSDKYINMTRSQILPGSNAHIKCNALSYHDIVGQLEYTVSGTDPEFIISDSFKFNLANNSISHMRLMFRGTTSYSSVDMFLTSPVRTQILAGTYSFDVGDSTFTFDGETFTRTAGTLVLHRVMAY